MIKKWNDFQKINELKHRTYQDAAVKLRKLGGVHKERASKMEQWSYISLGKHLGTFNMKFDIQSLQFENWKTKEKTWENCLVPNKITSKDVHRKMNMVKEGPLPVYLWGGLVDDLNEIYGDDMQDSLTHISCMFGAISEECYNTCYCFFISVKVEWVDDEMKIVPGSAELDTVHSGDSDVEGIAFFADRQSALKFKKQFLNQENMRNMVDGLDELREFFMEHSTGEEWNNYFKELQSISVNKIFN
jgi:hypothetical protein